LFTLFLQHKSATQQKPDSCFFAGLKTNFYLSVTFTVKQKNFATYMPILKVTVNKGLRKKEEEVMYEIEQFMYADVQILKKKLKRLQ